MHRWVTDVITEPPKRFHGRVDVDQYRPNTLREHTARPQHLLICHMYGQGEQFSLRRVYCGRFVKLLRQHSPSETPYELSLQADRKWRRLQIQNGELLFRS